MRKAMPLALLLLVGTGLSACVTDKGSVDASTSSRAKDDDDGDKPRQVCEHTSEGGEPKTVCY